MSFNRDKQEGGMWDEETLKKVFAFNPKGADLPNLFSFGFGVQFTYTGGSPNFQSYRTNKIILPDKRLLLKKVYSMVLFTPAAGVGSMLGHQLTIEAGQSGITNMIPPSVNAITLATQPPNTTPIIISGVSDLTLSVPSQANGTNVIDAPDGVLFSSDGMNVLQMIPQACVVGDIMTVGFAASFYVLP